MKKTTNTNDLMKMLPKIDSRRVWIASIDGKIVGNVSANSMMDAFDIVRSKYPTGSLELIRSK